MRWEARVTFRPPNQTLPVFGVCKATHDVEQGGLPGSVRPDETDQRAERDRDVHPVERSDTAEGDGDLPRRRVGTLVGVGIGEATTGGPSSIELLPVMSPLSSCAIAQPPLGGSANIAKVSPTWAVVPASTLISLSTTGRRRGEFVRCLRRLDFAERLTGLRPVADVFEPLDDRAFLHAHSPLR